jgi:hypothetical protein
LIPIVEVLEEYKHPDITTPSGKSLELDYFIPKFNIGVEYQVTTKN